MPFPLHTTALHFALKYDEPYDWEGVLAFLDLRKLRDVEHVGSGAYHRTVKVGRRKGWIRVQRDAKRSCLQVEHSASLRPVLPELVGRLRDLFDLDTDPRAISSHLRKDPLLTSGVDDCPGLRIPGAFDPFELTVRAILGQQITVKAATTIGGRFAAAFGELIETPFPELSRLTPNPHRVAEASVDEVAKLGIVSARSKCLISVAQAFADGSLTLDRSGEPLDAVARLMSLPGIGPWTAHYIAMRALRWTDAFPKEDIAIRNRLGGVSPKQAEERSQAWRPWRSYAVLHVWRLPANNKPNL